MPYPICKIENMTGEVLQLHQKEFAIGEIYKIDDDYRESWADNDDVLTAIFEEEIRVRNADNPIEGLSNQIDYLKALE